LATKIRLKRLGKKHLPFYRVVVADSRSKRDGKVIEEVGKYHPTEQPSYISLDSERIQYWLGVGAQPTEAVAALMKLTGDWQKFKGEKYDPETLKTKEAKADIVSEIEKVLDTAEEIKANASRKLAEAAKAAEKESEDDESEGGESDDA
jgi:small subunit ribosomal protein S16